MLLIMLFKNSQPVTTWDISPELILSILAILISICAIFFEYFLNIFGIKKLIRLIWKLIFSGIYMVIF